MAIFVYCGWPFLGSRHPGAVDWTIADCCPATRQCLGTAGRVITTIALFGPLFEQLQRWRNRAVISLVVWGALLLVEEIIAPSNEPLELAVVGACFIVSTVFLVFVVVVRNPTAIASFGGDSAIVGAVQAILALLIWVFLVLLIAISLAAGGNNTIGWDSFLEGGLAVLWNSADTIPVLSLPETIRWDDPLVNVDAQTGWLLVLARIAFVASVVAVVKALYDTHITRPG